jgi:shikimate 5-dehydrogenase
MIYTTRTNPMYRKKGEPEQYPQLIEYLDKNGIVYDQVYVGSGKPMADVYVDDRAIPFSGNWTETAEAVKNFKVWNRPEAKSSAELNSK